MISIGKTYDSKDNKFWTLEHDNLVCIECTYSTEFEIIDYFINRIKVKQSDIVVNLADNYDNDRTIADIMDYERTEKAHAEFLKDHEVPY